MKLRKRKPETIHDCRNMSSLSYSTRDDGLTGWVAAHEGRKPREGDYLVLPGDRGASLYRCVRVDWCMNVDPANMWMADVEFVPREKRLKLNLPELQP